jgi:hypothetical protein
LVSDILATVLANALCLLSSLDVRNQSSGPCKWVFMWGMEERDSDHLVLLLWFPNSWPCKHFGEFTGCLKFCFCRVWWWRDVKLYLMLRVTYVCTDTHVHIHTWTRT